MPEQSIQHEFTASMLAAAVEAERFHTEAALPAGSNGAPQEPWKKEIPMTLTALMRAAALTAIVSGGGATAATAQANATDPHHPDTTSAQATPPAEPGDAAGQGPGAQPGQPGMMPPGMMGNGMGQGMMQPGMMGGMPMMRMHGHMMKIMFAIADTDGDGALSFEEITAIQKRIFDMVDRNKDGKVTLEEVQEFMRE